MIKWSCPLKNIHNAHLVWWPMNREYVVKLEIERDEFEVFPCSIPQAIRLASPSYEERDLPHNLDELTTDSSGYPLLVSPEDKEYPHPLDSDNFYNL